MVLHWDATYIPSLLSTRVSQMSCFSSEPISPCWNFLTSLFTNNVISSRLSVALMYRFGPFSKQCVMSRSRRLEMKTLMGFGDVSTSWCSVSMKGDRVFLSHSSNASTTRVIWEYISNRSARIKWLSSSFNFPEAKPVCFFWLYISTVGRGIVFVFRNVDSCRTKLLSINVVSRRSDWFRSQ